ncbi:MAG: hypothetical protein JWL72_1020, partial [Ilumatobacteraceae bacterium]|nr:hypothetical protein [Ilumatobacteraceae bacterium]
DEESSWDSVDRSNPTACANSLWFSPESRITLLSRSWNVRSRS